MWCHECEGWHQRSIAGCLQLSRQHVGHILHLFARDGFAGLEDQRTRPTTRPANQLTLPFLKEVLDVQRDYPRAGRFRVRGLVARRTGHEPPSQTTIGRAMATNRRHHRAPEAWSTDRPDPSAPDGILKSLPYEPTHRHRFWFIDFRYLVQVGEGEDTHWVYSLCVIEGYSRKILAGMATQYQDAVAVLQLLAAALTACGRPEGLVSDNGTVITSAAYQGLLETLGITMCHIEKGKPWENLVEAQFKIERRLADAHFERAMSFEEIQERHAAFVETFNTTQHWAHQDRADGLRTSEEVLGWVQGRALAMGALEQALQQMPGERVVDHRGYVSMQRFYLYAERGLARKRVSVWLYDGRLQIAYQQALLAQYAYRADRRAKRLRTVERPRLYCTAYASPQLELWELDDTRWRKVLERSRWPRRHVRAPDVRVQQLALPGVGWALALLTLCLG
jgi:transposase InsO family protein